MSRKPDNENAFILVIIGIAAILALGVWKFSGAINVNFETGLNVIIRIAVVVAVSVALLVLDVLSFGAVLPGLLAGLVWAMFPAFDYWAFGETPFAFELNNPAWYARWYTKAAFILLPTVGGYGYMYAKSSR